MRGKFLYFGFLTLQFVAATAAVDAAADPLDGEVSRIEIIIQAGDYRLAETALDALLSSHPESWRGQYQLGYVDFQLHSFQKSVTALCKSLLLNPSFPDAHRILAYDLNVLGKQELAIQELQTAIRLDPTSADSHYELGRIFYERGAYAQAVDQLLQAKEIAPDMVRTYHNLGLAYAAIGENRKAVECFEEALRRNQQQRKPSAWAFIDYATFQNMQGKFDSARTMLLKAIEIDDSFPQEFDELSKSYRGLGETPQAIDALKHAVELDPKKAEYHYVLARLYTKTHKSVEAQAELAAYQKSLPANGGN